MKLNRRSMLRYSLASVALTLTGCTKANTTVVVRNQLGAVLRIKANASAQGKTYRFNKAAIAIGGSATQKYTVKGAPKGLEVPFNITELKIRVKVNNKWTWVDVEGLDLPDLFVQIGTTNVFVISEEGVTRTPELPAEEGDDEEEEV